MADTFRAYVLEDADGKQKGGFRQLSVSELPAQPVLVDIAYSCLNYKDGLAVTGKGKIARKLPMVCGIDLAGKVEKAAERNEDVDGSTCGGCGTDRHTSALELFKKCHGNEAAL